jgi:hypothetical protein
MTFNEYVVKFCIDRGMWPDQAEKVLENMRQTQATIGFDDLRWQDHIEGYPSMLMIGFGLNIKTAALKFIDETMPQAFFRPLFAD